MKISRRALINIVLGVVLVGIIVAGLIVFLPKGSSSAQATQLTTTVKEGTVSSTITASGSIEPLETVAQSFAVDGTIAQVDVAVGDTVAYGQTIGVLAKKKYTEALAEAESQLSDAYDAVDDAESAVSSANTAVATASTASTTTTTGQGGQGAGASTSSGTSAADAAQQLTSATSQLSSANEQVSTAQDAVDTAEANLKATTLKAAHTGTVIAVNGEVGATTSAGTTTTTAGGTTTSSSSTSTGSTGSSSSGGFVTIAVVSKMTMTASIAEADIADVKVGQAVSIDFPALTDTTATAKVTAISPTATSSNSVVTYATTITLDSIPDGLRLGQTADATITTESSADDALYVPTAAVTTSSDGTSSVKVVETDGTTKTVAVETGVVGDDGTEITSGLTSGETIVLGSVSATTSTTTGTGTGTGTGRTGTGGFGGTGGFTGGGTGGFGGGTGGGFGSGTGGGFPGGNN